MPSLFVDRPSPNQPSLDQPRVLFATAELSPVARVGGLGEAAAGLTAALERAGIDVEIVLPDYDNRSLADETVEDLDVPEWVGAARARRGIDASGRAITVVAAPTIARPHPYLDPATGEGWIDNDHRFAAFCAGVAAITKTHRPEIVHLNDWHTGLVAGMLDAPPPIVLTIHTIAYQGTTSDVWLDRLGTRRDAFEWFDVRRKGRFQDRGSGTSPLVIDGRQGKVALGGKEVIEAALLHAGVGTQVFDGRGGVTAGVDAGAGTFDETRAGSARARHS